MIQANDLRIGNLFYLNDDDLIENQNVYEGIAIHKITGEDVNMADFSNDDFNMFYKPIPITEEWILRFGAAPFFMNGLQTHFRIGLHMIRFDGDDFYLELGKGMNIELTHIHQLQNLYFALTQTELTLKW
jgi:hypothetical protein